MQKRAVFYVYVIFWEQSGQADVVNGAMLTTYLFRYTSECTQNFQNFLRLRRQGGIDPLTKILRTFLTVHGWPFCSEWLYSNSGFFPQSAGWCFLFVWFLRRIFHLSRPIILFRVSMPYVVISLQSATFCHVYSLVFVSRDKVAEMPNSHRSSNTTKRSCPCRVRCAGCELNDCCGGVQTSNFSVGDSLESNSHQRSGRDTDKTVLSCPAGGVNWAKTTSRKTTRYVAKAAQ